MYKGWRHGGRGGEKGRLKIQFLNWIKTIRILVVRC